MPSIQDVLRYETVLVQRHSMMAAFTVILIGVALVVRKLRRRTKSASPLTVAEASNSKQQRNFRFIDISHTGRLLRNMRLHVARGHAFAAEVMPPGPARSRAPSAAIPCPVESDSTADPPSLLGSSSELHTVLPLAALCPLRAALPVRLRQHDWRLAFSTDQHGCSLQTLYRRLASRGPSLLVVLDADGSVFGGFASESWRADASHYFGTGERPPRTRVYLEIILRPPGYFVDFLNFASDFAPDQLSDSGKLASFQNGAPNTLCFPWKFPETQSAGDPLFSFLFSGKPATSQAATAVWQPSCGRADGWDTAIAAIGRRMAALAGRQPKWRVLGGRSG
ncbi:hypothetical protein EMIHUDRAFT_238357 [Emiliania huxleyi CCMP1516]|uniref:Oxidation resistance protein 1 n=2 Tax=Emiliania huxleyi TaxID=2903 RepID=A0A0D3JMM3_EMIH1|nr:hypothetical protein EMIHUDRAFT_238357 [Emiliania huxleyi CCMP1516]EOD24758.1 hypothetical protein EMIHUDRAFT_238357 [Emiliania huxleyi CCMP1516]|eukprot:XP_005777187.1 hypothetical protein EMIHUDRAFT_238357 [Emiliania huxleyi CCMP1516]